MAKPIQGANLLKQDESKIHQFLIFLIGVLTTDFLIQNDVSTILLKCFFAIVFQTVYFHEGNGEFGTGTVHLVFQLFQNLFAKFQGDIFQKIPGLLFLLIFYTDLIGILLFFYYEFLDLADQEKYLQCARLVQVHQTSIGIEDIIKLILYSIIFHLFRNAQQTLQNLDHLIFARPVGSLIIRKLLVLFDFGNQLVFQHSETIIQIDIIVKVKQQPVPTQKRLELQVLLLKMQRMQQVASHVGIAVGIL